MPKYNIYSLRGFGINRLLETTKISNQKKLAEQSLLDKKFGRQLLCTRLKGPFSGKTS